MPITVSCSCGKAYRLPDSAAGKRAKCAQCGRVVVVPQPEPKDVPNPADAVPENSPSPPSSTSETRRPVSRSPQPGEPRRPTPDRPTLDDRAKELARERYQHLAPEKPSTNLLDYAYWLLLLTFIPLAFSLLQDKKEDPEDQLARSAERSSSAQEEKRTSGQRLAPEYRFGAPTDTDEADGPELSVVEWIDVLTDHMPENRLAGAFLPRKTWVHWLYAFLAGGAFLALTVVLFADAGQALHLLAIGAFTATIGIVLLFLVQLLAGWTQGRILISRNFIILLLYWIAWAIGFSYRAATDPTLGLIPSFFGFTFGVGFCEEVCKALPLLWHYRVKGALPWRTACAWGFASGVGFGVSEGIMYSARYYNGVAAGDMYLVRFISCVALHGIWSASAALFIHKFQHILQAEFAWYEFIPRALFLVGIPMVLHGLYDAFLKKELNGLALLTAVASFAWLVWSIERTRAHEESPQLAPGRA